LNFAHDPLNSLLLKIKKIAARFAFGVYVSTTLQFNHINFVLIKHRDNTLTIPQVYYENLYITEFANTFSMEKIKTVSCNQLRNIKMIIYMYPTFTGFLENLVICIKENYKDHFCTLAHAMVRVLYDNNEIESNELRLFYYRIVETFAKEFAHAIENSNFRIPQDFIDEFHIPTKKGCYKVHLMNE
jgi:hypothetical protein